MPAVSKAQQKLMQIAEHHPDELYAENKGAAKMSHEQLHDFAKGSEKGKPEHVAHKKHEEPKRGHMSDAHSGHGRHKKGRGEGSY